jgi:hypothetical protein
MKEKLNYHYLHGTNPFFMYVIFLTHFLTDNIFYKLA